MRGTIACAALLLLAGCEPAKVSGPVAAVGNGPPAPPIPPPPPAAVPAAQDNAPAAPPVTTTPPLAAPVAPPPAAAGGSPQRAQAQPGAELAVQLRTGVALPQTLPDGTRVGVSVDYEVVGGLQTSSNYFLAVTAASQGREILMSVELSAAGGSLQSFLPADAQPEAGPFTARIVEVQQGGRLAIVSNSVPLK